VSVAAAGVSVASALTVGANPVTVSAPAAGVTDTPLMAIVAHGIARRGGARNLCRKTDIGG